MTPSGADDASADDARTAYERAVDAIGADSVHDLVARRGLAVVELDVPLLVTAARWHRLDDRRRRHRQEQITAANPSDVLPAPPLWDPVSQLDDQRGLALILRALSEFDDADVKLIWDRLEDRDYEEILRELTAGRSRPITAAGLRQRHSRLLKRLEARVRELMASDEPTGRRTDP